MPEDNSEWMDSLFLPSSTASAGAILVGTWCIFLNIINIAIGAFSEGRKVLWIDFLTNGSNTNSEWEMGVLIGDIIFGGIGIAILSVGIIGMSKAREDGISGWIGGLPSGPVLSSLISTDGGITRTLASWLALSGMAFYFYWGALNNTWVDPGVYSVSIALVSFGLGLHILQEAESSQ